MMQPECYIAYAPRGGGLLCAVTYFAYGDDVAGWFAGLKDYAYPAAYFRIENFFSAGDKRFYATRGSDIYGGWCFDYANPKPDLDPPVAVDDALCHPLDVLQDAFVAEWLVFRDDVRFPAEDAAYTANDLPAGDALIHYARLARFDREKPVWTYYSRGFNDEVLNYAATRWPLDYGRD